MNLNALAQLAMVASMLPFLHAISDPSRIESNSVFTGFRDFFGPIDDHAFLLVLGAVVIATVCIANFLRALHGILGARFASKLSATLSAMLLRNYLMRPYPFFLNRNSSEFLRNIFSEVDLVCGGFLQTTMDAVSRLLTIIALSVLLLMVNPWIALGAGVFFGGSYGVIYLTLRRRLFHIANQRAEADNLRYKAVSEAFGTIKELKVLGRERNFITAFTKPSRLFFRYQERAHLYSELPRNLVETVAFAGMVGVALVILSQHNGVTDALPMLGLFAVASYRLFPAIQGIYRCSSQLRYYRPSVDTIFKEFSPTMDGRHGVDHSIDFVDAVEGRDHQPLPLRKGITLKDIHYIYPNSKRPAIHGLNLTIPARSRVGLCGKSGSGKTTVADIVLGLLEPHEGQMLVDGVKIDESNRARWQLNCGYVPQRIYLTDDTIQHNIAFGISPEAIDEEAVRKAAKLANLSHYIEHELPDRYHTKVGEDGIRLSGGQRQRIGIARALYHDPDIIILDEATSALDPETEQAIVEAVQSLSGSKTILMIAHRLSTIRESDFIVFMENGSIAEIGTFDGILNRSDPFRRLAALA